MKQCIRPAITTALRRAILVSTHNFRPTYPTSTPATQRPLKMSYCSGADPTDQKLLFLRARFARDLKDFAEDSTSTFRIIHTIPSTQNPPSRTNNQLSDLKTLYVLDSSFNPPTKAHLTIALNALRRDAKGISPARLILLLATENADKKPKPASFEDRLVMMSLRAEDLRSSLRAENSSASPTGSLGVDGNGQATNADISVDVAVTKHPYFMDKAMSIDESGIYGNAQQVHLTGYDTIIRIFNSKYYPADKKLRVLEPFLSKHRLRVCYRVGGEQKREEDRQEQEAYVDGIGDGSREDEGMRREWRQMVELVDDAKDVEGVSSTLARKTAVDGDSEALENLTGEKIAQYVTGQGLYEGG